MTAEFVDLGRNLRGTRVLDSKTYDRSVSSKEPLPADLEERRTVFLAGFAVALGADNLAMGMLATVPFFVQRRR